jgi:hypothetical protein
VKKSAGGLPSAILNFRDEYPELVDESLAKKAVNRRKRFTFDEFIVREMDAKRIPAKGGVQFDCTDIVSRIVGSLVP